MIDDKNKIDLKYFINKFIYRKVKKGKYII